MQLVSHVPTLRGDSDMQLVSYVFDFEIWGFGPDPNLIVICNSFHTCLPCGALAICNSFHTCLVPTLRGDSDMQLVSYVPTMRGDSDMQLVSNLCQPLRYTGLSNDHHPLRYSGL